MNLTVVESPSQMEALGDLGRGHCVLATMEHTHHLPPKTQGLKRSFRRIQVDIEQLAR